MAKSKATEEEPKGIAPAAPAPLSTEVLDYGDFKGMGYENTTKDDYKIPMLGIIQGLSPEIKKAEPEYMPEAQEGMMIDSVLRTLYPGDKGVIIVPCDTLHEYTEWVPRESGGGFKGSHPLGAEIISKSTRGQGPNASKLITPAGTHLVETYSVFALMLDSFDSLEGRPIVIPFTSSKIKKYREGMTRLQSIAGRPPLFAHRVLLVTVPEKNNKGSYYNFDWRPANKSVKDSLIPLTKDGAPHPLLKRGHDLMKLVRSGKVKADQPSQGRDAGEDDAPF